jgi:flagellar protein FliT
MTAYEALADIAQRELELVSAGAVERLPELRAERNALFATLPGTPPAAARPALERAAALQARITAMLEERLQQTGEELRRLTHGRAAMRGYAPLVEPRKLVDRAG